MRVQQQAAFLLHHRDYGETSLLVELFSRDHGRIGAIAKGARRAQHKQGRVLLPFQSLLVSWSGRGELVVLTSVEAAGNSPVLYGEALFCGFYVNELMLRLLHRYDPHPELYAAYGLALKGLATQPLQAVLRLFEKRLLSEIGYGLVLDHEINDNLPIDPDASYRYVPDGGPVRDTGAQQTGIKVQGATLLALSQERLTDEGALQEAKSLMRAVLSRLLGDKPLNSRRLFRELKSGAAPGAKSGET